MGYEPKLTDHILVIRKDDGTIVSASVFFSHVIPASVGRNVAIFPRPADGKTPLSDEEIVKLYIVDESGKLAKK